jgi:HSP20 family protein
MAAVKEMAPTKANGPEARTKGEPELSGREAGRAERLARRASATAMRVGSPFAFIRRFAEEMDRLMEDFGVEHGVHMPSFLSRGHELLRREAGLTEADWSPHVDVCEREGRFLVRADLPGMTKDEIKVELTADLLTLQGERRRETKEEREGYRYSECAYGRFYRAIPLPEGVDTSKATAEFRGGVLEIALPAPKSAAPEARRLEVVEKK